MAGKMRRREPEPERAAAVEVEHEPVTDAERLDARALAAMPDDVAADPERALAWAAAHLPLAIRAEVEVRADRAARAKRGAWSRAKTEARRAGRPAPRAADFLGPDYHGPD